MNVQIQSLKFDADKRLLDFVNAKIEKLDRFEDKITSAEVILKIDKNHDDGNKVVNIILNVPGNELIAERRAHTFEEAVDAAFEALKNQIAKYKAK